MADDSQTQGAVADQSPGTISIAPLLRQGLFVFLLSCMGALFLQVNPGFVAADEGTSWSWNRNQGLGFGDGPYHIKAAYLYRTGEVPAAGSDFHWTRASIWNGSFSDKEFLYHIYLVPFTFLAEDEFHWQAFVTGAKLSAVVAAGLFMLSMFVTLRLLNVPRAWFWLLAGGAMMGPLLAGRLAEPRSWVFGVSLAMLGWGALCRGAWKWVFGITVLYVLTYTGSHLMLAMALFRAAFHFAAGPAEGKRVPALVKDLKLAGVVLAGLVVGWALHPESIALLKVWWVQNLLVPYVHAEGTPTGLLHSLSTSLLGWAPNATMPATPQHIMGQELLAPELGLLIRASTYELVAPLLLPLASLLLRVKPTRLTLATFLIGLGFVVLHLQNGRFVEYAVPFLLISGAMWLCDMSQARTIRSVVARFRQHRRRAMPTAVAVLLLLLTANLYRAGEMIGFRPQVHMPAVAAWMQEAPALKGKVIYNLRWDSFPELFMYRSDCDYIWGMDPVFTSARADGQAARVVGFMTGDMRQWGSGPADVVSALRNEFKADFLMIHDFSKSRDIYRQVESWAAMGLLEPELLQPGEGIAIYRVP